jgi:hypothetical protein
MHARKHLAKGDQGLRPEAGRSPTRPRHVSAWSAS